MRKRIIECYTEKEMSMQELVEKFIELMGRCRKEGFCVDFITQRPVYNDDGDVMADENGLPMITTDFPAELQAYRYEPGMGEAYMAMKEYISAHNYSKADYPEYSEDPVWKELNKRLIIENKECPEMD